MAEENGALVLVPADHIQRQEVIPQMEIWKGKWMLDNQSVDTGIAPHAPSEAGWFPIPKQLQQAPKDTSVKSTYTKRLLEAALNL